MASELVKEIDSWIGTFDKRGIAEFVVGHDEAKALLSTLQRAREALSWIPVSERLPERDGYYLVTYKSNAGAEIDYFEKARADRNGGFDCNPDNPVIAWMECPKAYTPEESSSSAKATEDK